MESFHYQELRSAETIGRTVLSPAVSGKDFVKTKGTLVFEPGQRSTVLDITLTPETGSLNPFPKRFQIVLSEPQGGARVDDMYGVANVTLVSDADSQAVWGLAEQLHQPLDADILSRVLHTLSLRVATENTEEQLSAVVHLIGQVRGACQPSTWFALCKFTDQIKKKSHSGIRSVTVKLRQSREQLSYVDLFQGHA